MMEMFWYRWCLSDPDSGTDGRWEVPEMIRGHWGYPHFKVSRSKHSVRHKLHSSIPSSLCTLINNGQPHSECKYLRLTPAAVFNLKYFACNPRPGQIALLFKAWLMGAQMRLHRRGGKGAEIGDAGMFVRRSSDEIVAWWWHHCES